MPDNQNEERDEALQAPPELVSALRQLPPEPVFVPRTVDEAILRAAEKQLGKPGRSQRTWRGLWRWGTATAAALLVLTAIPLYLKRTVNEPGPKPGFAREDVNHDGRVDILDAFALARQLKAGGLRDLRLDVNGDGRVDERDVTALAGRAVKLEKGGQS